ncbi:PQQ-binding-like beta-propeller repeat protein [Marinactinospora rubrisoli]|uniref:PQQ-binding-like beta-propeller repeat protein n=1 Tax=Marinactinospora rubrisoli TaxID=2715399 RepID=A0ABW2KIH0_9ACTN
MGFARLGAADLRARRAGAAVGLVAGGAALALVLQLVTTLSVDATTAGPSDEQAAVPSDFSRIGWTWETPGGQAVVGGVRAGAGVVVRFGDGIAALDSATGAERWHYRRPGATSGEVFASPDGSTVLATFESSGAAGIGALPVVVDPHSGEVRAEYPQGEYVVSQDRLVMTSHSFLTLTSEGEVAAFDLDSGRRSWTFSAPKRCHRLEGGENRPTCPWTTWS